MHGRPRDARRRHSRWLVPGRKLGHLVAKKLAPKSKLHVVGICFRKANTVHWPGSVRHLGVREFVGIWERGNRVNYGRISWNCASESISALGDSKNALSIGSKSAPHLRKLENGRTWFADLEDECVTLLVRSFCGDFRHADDGLVPHWIFQFCRSANDRGTASQSEQKHVILRLPVSDADPHACWHAMYFPLSMVPPVICIHIYETIVLYIMVAGTNQPPHALYKELSDSP
jgi:hypothetical protein